VKRPGNLCTLCNMPLMQSLYTLLIYLITPLLLLLLFIRGLQNRNWLKRWPQRFGWFDSPEKPGSIVVHAVSVGEVNIAGTLVKALAERFPERPLCLTTFTPTGSDRVLSLSRTELFHVYLPFDLPGAVKRFFDRVQPTLLIILETEIWPNLYIEARQRNIPVMIVNARISERSIRGYRRLKWLSKIALDQVSRIAAQSKTDAGRLIDIGADKARLEVSGNLKFDVGLPPDLAEQGKAIRTTWGDKRLVLLAGSTHEGDEKPVLEAFKHLLKEYPQALLVLVPRHPERFGRAAQLARASGLTVCLHSEQVDCPSSAQCFIVDTMGELLRYYAACDVAFVGGSLANVGGHNALEPAALAKPVLFGPHTCNFEDIANKLLNSGAAIRVNSARELEEVTMRLFRQADLRKQMGLAGLELIKGGQGALQRTLEIVQELITPEAG
jgi:3-deoxy-D-manno-octulosonic-acid transferase